MIRRIIAWLTACLLVVLGGVTSVGTAQAGTDLVASKVTSPQCGVARVAVHALQDTTQEEYYEVIERMWGSSATKVLDSFVLPDANGSLSTIREYRFPEDSGTRRVMLSVNGSEATGADIHADCVNPTVFMGKPFCKEVKNRLTGSIGVFATLKNGKSRVDVTYTLTLKGKLRAKQRSWTVPKHRRDYVTVFFRGKRLGGETVVAKIRANGEVLAKRRIPTGLCT
jgi:hypothetical protein